MKEAGRTVKEQPRVCSQDWGRQVSFTANLSATTRGGAAGGGECSELGQSMLQGEGKVGSEEAAASCAMVSQALH